MSERGNHSAFALICIWLSISTANRSIHIWLAWQQDRRVQWVQCSSLVWAQECTPCFFSVGAAIIYNFQVSLCSHSIGFTEWWKYFNLIARENIDRPALSGGARWGMREWNGTNNTRSSKPTMHPPWRNIFCKWMNKWTDKWMNICIPYFFHLAPPPKSAPLFFF